MPGVVEDAGSRPRGYWGMLLACFFKGSTEGEEQRFHALEGQRGFFIVVDAGDGGGWGLVGLVD